MQAMSEIREWNLALTTGHIFFIALTACLTVVQGSTDDGTSQDFFVEQLSSSKQVSMSVNFSYKLHHIRPGSCHAVQLSCSRYGTPSIK